MVEVPVSPPELCDAEIEDGQGRSIRLIADDIPNGVRNELDAAPSRIEPVFLFVKRLAARDQAADLREAEQLASL
ncbi:MAG: hypothetical protein Q9227_002970 [Pyrenula ochraceoflavens]